MTHAAHAMAHTAHSMHAMEPRMGRSKARAVIDTSRSSHSSTVATADVSSTFPMNAIALAVDSLAFGFCACDVAWLERFALLTSLPRF